MRKIILWIGNNIIKILKLIKTFNTIDVMIYVYIIIYFLNQSLYVAIVMNESIIVGIDLIKTCIELSGTTDKIYIKLNENKEDEIRTTIEHVNHNLITYNMYNMSMYSKYIFYVLLISVSYIYKILLWTSNDHIINVLLLLLTTKPLKTLIFNCEYFIKLIEKIDAKLNNIYCYVLSKISAIAINNLNKICIGIDSNIRYYELLNFFENFSEYKDSIMIALKSIMNHMVVASFKNSKNSMVRYIFTFIHKYQIEELTYISNILNNSNDLNLLTKPEIGAIIQSRNWNKLLAQKSINSILRILAKVNDDTKYVQININKIMFSVLRYFTFWTFIYVNQIVAILSDILIIYRGKIEVSKINIAAYILGILIVNIYSYSVGTFICVYGHLFINIIINFLKDVEISKFYNKTTKYICAATSICVLRHAFLSQVLMAFYYNRNYNNNNINNIYGNILMLTIYLLSMFSNFYFVHIILTCLVYYIVSLFLCESHTILFFKLDEIYIKKPDIVVKMNLIKEPNTFLEHNNNNNNNNNQKNNSECDYIILDNYMT